MKRGLTPHGRCKIKKRKNKVPAHFEAIKKNYNFMRCLPT